MMLVAAGNDVDVSDKETKSKLMAAKLKEKAQLNTSRNYCRDLPVGSVYSNLICTVLFKPNKSVKLIFDEV